MKIKFLFFLLLSIPVLGKSSNCFDEESTIGGTGEGILKFQVKTFEPGNLEDSSNLGGHTVETFFTFSTFKQEPLSTELKNSDINQEKDLEPLFDFMEPLYTIQEKSQIVSFQSFYVGSIPLSPEQGLFSYTLHELNSFIKAVGWTTPQEEYELFERVLPKTGFAISLHQSHLGKHVRKKDIKGSGMMELYSFEIRDLIKNTNFNKESHIIKTLTPTDTNQTFNIQFQVTYECPKTPFEEQ